MLWCSHAPSLLLCVAERASQLVAAATEAGALAFLQTGVLDSVPMQVGCCGGVAVASGAGQGPCLARWPCLLRCVQQGLGEGRAWRGSMAWGSAK